MVGNGLARAVVTTSSEAVPKPLRAKKPPKETGKERVYFFIKGEKTPVGPKYIARETGLNASSVKVYCRRLTQEARIVRTPTGYTLPVTSFEQQLERRLMLDGQKHSLPKLHDIHLTFKPENIKVALKNPELWHPTVHVTYEMEGRGPDAPETPQVHIPGYNDKGYPSGLPDYLKRFFNTIDKDSIYQLWKVNKGSYKEIKGGFQEQFDFGTYRLTFQLFGTGTIKIMVAASEHPLDLQQWRETLAGINSLFLSKTGVQFFDISNFFHFERLHAGTDLLAGSIDLAGTSKLTCTVRQFDDWLHRIYEKVLGDELFVRNEICLEKGNYANHSYEAFNGFLALLEGGVTPGLINAQLFATKRDSDDLEKVVRRQQNQIHGLTKVAENQSNQIRELLTAIRQVSPGTTGLEPASDFETRRT